MFVFLLNAHKIHTFRRKDTLKMLKCDLSMLLSFIQYLVKELDDRFDAEGNTAEQVRQVWP